MIAPASQQPQRSAHDDAEYRRNYLSAEYINALYALDNNWLGQGVLVGVLDNGVTPIGDLQGKVDLNLSRDFGYIEKDGVRTFRTGEAQVGDDASTHGTPVAAIIAARNDGQNVQGLAPGATIVSLRVDGIRDGEQLLGFNRDAALRYAADNGIRLVNMSLVLQDDSDPSTAFMNAMSYFNRRGRGLLVASAGNSSLETSPNAREVDPAHAESWLFVAAIESDGRGYNMAGYSNRCGTIMARCVVAPGSNVTMGAGGQVVTFAGTSSAAPVVTAVAAMILSKWPQLTGIDAGNIIIRSARDLGAPGVDPVFGHGLVDAAAALRPVNPQLSNSVTSAPLDGNVMVIGGSFGGMGTASLKGALGDVTLLDHYGRDYRGDLTSLVIERPVLGQSAIERRIEAQMNARTGQLLSPLGSVVIGASAFDTGLRDAGGVPVLRGQLTNADLSIVLSEAISLVGGVNSASNVTTDILGLAPTSDAMLAYLPQAQSSFGISSKVGKGHLIVTGHMSGAQGAAGRGASMQFKRGATSLKFGMLDERAAVFGTPVGAGMMRFGDGARTYFAELASGFDLGAWRLDGFGSVGRTRLRLGPDMLLTDAGAITTARFGLIASRPVWNGRFRFGLGQPLVALGGHATFTVGRGYSLDARALQFEERRVDLAGRARPQFTVGYERTGPRSDLRLGAATDGGARDVRGVATWILRFGAQ